MEEMKKVRCPICMAVDCKFPFEYNVDRVGFYAIHQVKCRQCGEFPIQIAAKVVIEQLRNGGYFDDKAYSAFLNWIANNPRKTITQRNLHIEILPGYRERFNKNESLQLGLPAN